LFSCLQAIEIKHPSEHKKWKDGGEASGRSTKNGKMRERHQEETKQNVGNKTRNTALYQTFYGK